MSIYQLGQEFSGLRWGTAMPVPLMVAGSFIQVRARGLCSLIVSNSTLLEAHMADPESLPAWLKAQVVTVVTDVLGELGSKVSQVQQLTTVTPAITSAVETILSARLNPIGLQVKSLVIEAIEKL